MPGPATTRRLSSRLPLATFLVALLMTAVSGLVAVWWGAIDQRFLETADDAGWDENLLLPHQTGLTLAVDGVLLLSVVLTGASFVALRRSRRP